MTPPGLFTCNAMKGFHNIKIGRVSVYLAVWLIFRKVSPTKPAFLASNETGKPTQVIQKWSFILR